MPSRACSSFEADRAPPRHADVVDGFASSRDDIDSLSEWYRTPRIPEEPDCCDILPFMRNVASLRTGGSVAHSRTSSLGVEEASGGGAEGAEGAGGADGYLPMAPAHPSSSGSVCSGTPSTDPRFSEYQLEPATSHIAEERSTRAYSVGSRPARERCEPARLRAYSAGARRRPAPHAPHVPHVPHPPRVSTDDLMEIDFSANSPQPKVIVARTPPTAGFSETPKSKPNMDEYVDMSPRNAGYVEMRPGEPPSPAPAPAAAPAGPAAPATPAAPAPDGYVEMSYGRNNRVPTRPIAIANPRPPPAVSSSPEIRRIREPRTPHGSQTIFPFSPDSPASPPELDDSHALSTVREISEEGRKSPEREREAGGRLEVSSSPQYVTLARPDNLNNNKTARLDEHRGEDFFIIFVFYIITRINNR
ncbi:translation initiation factor IF-2 [Zerene cesonia]|uniref:translation initiation factor IF-2 n=1 Tax=Zerene cesonia TaxID=33412 RepID=UPI0018E562A0|nr:translation initiation factor IF-2 [Zerene cesonia]